jgi:hypothetical protein
LRDSNLIGAADSDYLSVTDEDSSFFDGCGSRRGVDAGPDKGDCLVVVVLLAKGEGSGEQAKQE